MSALVGLTCRVFTADLWKTIQRYKYNKNGYLQNCFIHFINLHAIHCDTYFTDEGNEVSVRLVQVLKASLSTLPLISDPGTFSFSDLPPHPLSRTPQFIFFLTCFLTCTHSVHTSFYLICGRHYCDVITHLCVHYTRLSQGHLAQSMAPIKVFWVVLQWRSRQPWRQCKRKRASVNNSVPHSPFADSSHATVGCQAACSQIDLWTGKTWGLRLTCPGTLKVTLQGDRHLGNGSFIGR